MMRAGTDKPDGDLIVSQAMAPAQTHPTTLPAPPANRLRRPSWRDPRLVVGLILVAVSVAAGSWLVDSAQGSTPVWVARHTLTPGTELTAQHLEVGDVRLGAAQLEGYLDATAPLADGLVVLRTVAAGELVPSAAVGDRGVLDVRPVPVTVPDPGSAVTAGAVVDLWFVPAEAGEPEVLARGLTVDEVTSSGGAFAQGVTVVHVLVPEAELPVVLAATSGPGEVRLVPVLGGS